MSEFGFDEMVGGEVSEACEVDANTLLQEVREAMHGESPPDCDGMAELLKRAWRCGDDVEVVASCYMREALRLIIAREMDRTAATLSKMDARRTLPLRAEDLSKVAEEIVSKIGLCSDNVRFEANRTSKGLIEVDLMRVVINGARVTVTVDRQGFFFPYIKKAEEGFRIRHIPQMMQGE